MSQTAVTGGGPPGVAFGVGSTTSLFGAFGSTNFTTSSNGTEANAQTKNRGASTLQYLRGWVGANTASTALRGSSGVATAAVNQSIWVSWGSGAIVASDSTHTDSLSDGALYDYAWSIISGTGAWTLNSVTAQLVASAQCFCQQTGFGSVAFTTSATRWTAFGGALTNISTEANAQIAAMESATLSNLQALTTAGASAATLSSRVATAAGNQSVSLSSASGFFEDTTHSDSLSVGNLYDAQLAMGASSKTIKVLAVKYLGSTTNGSPISSASTTVVGTGQASYWAMGGSCSKNTSESTQTMATPVAGTGQNLTANITANAVASTQNFSFRPNGGAGNQVATTVASTPGIITDATHTDSLTSGETIDCTTGSTWTSSLTVASYGMLFVAPSSGSVYNVSASEAGASADAVTSAAIDSATMAESGAASDSPSDTAVLPSSGAEAGSASDAPSSAAVLGAGALEAGSALDSTLDAATLPASSSDAGAATDSTSSALSTADSRSEAGAGLDSVSSIAIVASTTSEAGSAADAASDAAVLASSIAEVGAAADVTSDMAVLPSGASDAAAASDSVSDAATLPSAIAESGAAADSETTGSSVAGAVVEAGSAAETENGALVLVGAASEAGAAAEVAAAVALDAVGVVDSGAAGDVAGAGAVLASAAGDALAASDAVASIATFIGRAADGGAAADAPASSAVISDCVAEAGAAADTASGAEPAPYVAAWRAVLNWRALPFRRR